MSGLESARAELSPKRTLVIAVHDSTDQLACVHIAESDKELIEVLSVAAAVGPVWTFPLVDGELLQEWFEVGTRRGSPARPTYANFDDPACLATWHVIADAIDAPNYPDYPLPGYRDEFEQLSRVPIEERPSAWMATIEQTNGDGDSQADALRLIIDRRLVKS